MKRILKYFKMVPLMLLLMFSLSGCVSLQDLKDGHAVWKDSSEQTIIWQEKEYNYLTDSTTSNFAPEYDFKDYIRVTENDVPTLLAFFEGDYVSVSKDRNYLEVYEKIYCVEEKFAEVQERLKEDVEMNHYAYMYYEISEANGTYAMCLNMLTEEETELLKKIEENSVVGTEYTDYSWVAELYICSEDKLFNQYRNIDLCKTTDGEYFFESYAEEEYAVYKIPKEYYDSIEKIFADAIKASEENIGENDEVYYY